MKPTLQAYFDPRANPVDLPPEHIALRERTRLIQAGMLARCVWSMKRRLGQDATHEELANDKQISRRVEHCELKYAQMWGDEPVNGEDLRISAAQVRWEDWLAETLSGIGARRLRIATWAIRYGYEREGRQFVHRLCQEEADLQRIRRLYFP